MNKCPVCNEDISKNILQYHFPHKHPEYKFTRKVKDGTTSVHYYCNMCGATVSGSRDLEKHYREFHPEAIDHATNAEKTGIISEKSLTVSDLDRLLNRVNENIDLLQQERKKNRELFQKCTEYAARIVELQNQLAQESRNRY